MDNEDLLPETLTFQDKDNIEYFSSDPRIYLGEADLGGGTKRYFIFDFNWHAVQNFINGILFRWAAGDNSYLVFDYSGTLTYHTDAGGNRAFVKTDTSTLSNYRTNTWITANLYTQAFIDNNFFTQLYIVTNYRTKAAQDVIDAAQDTAITSEGTTRAAADLIHTAGIAANGVALTTHKSSSDHDGRYYTETEIDAELSIGSGNTIKVPCVLVSGVDSTGHSHFQAGGYSTNRLTGALVIMGVCNLPTNRNGKKLYVKSIEVGLADADANNYLDQIRLFGCQYTGLTALFTDGTNKTTPAALTYTPGSVVDCSSYDFVYAYIDVQTNTATNLDIAYVNLEIYYAT